MHTPSDPSLHERLADARERLAKLRAAIREAESRADATEQARIAAEKLYVDRVADAMANGESTPAKSAELKRLQNDDDVADAALDSLKLRLGQLEGEVRGAAFALMQSSARTLANQRAEQVATSCQKIIPAFATLVRAAGINEARALVERMIADGAWSKTNAEHLDDVLQLANGANEVHGIDVVLHDYENETVRPRRATIGDLVTAFHENSQANIESAAVQ